MGSEMCIRDRTSDMQDTEKPAEGAAPAAPADAAAPAQPATESKGEEAA